MAEETEQHSGKASAGEGFKKIWAWIQKHPYEAAAAFGVLLLLIVWYYLSAPAQAAPVQASTGGSDQATLAAELQQEATNAQETAALQGQQQAAAVAENNNATTLQGESIASAATISLANILADIQGQQITTQGSVDLAQIASNTTLGLANASNQALDITDQYGAVQYEALAPAFTGEVAAHPGSTFNVSTGGGATLSYNPVPVTPTSLAAEGFNSNQISNYYEVGRLGNFTPDQITNYISTGVF